MIHRRAFLAGVGTATAVSLAGCTSEAVGDSCEEETVVDEYDTYSAGQNVTWRIEMEENQKLAIEAVQTGDGARPKLEVENPNGTLAAEVGPSENIDRTVTAQTDGTYYVRFVNEAFINTGQWDITITLRSEGC
ncbi:hypothetical protein [Halostagnicola bangensis]